MSVDTLKAYIEAHLDIWYSPWHGIQHWDQVWQNAQSIGWSEGADMEVVEYFAYLHDSQRWDEGEDPEHGPRAAAFAKAHRELFDLTDAQFNLLLRAVSGHTVAMPGQKAGEDPTLAVCWDADRMDIGRVGKIVDPDYLFTGMAKELVLLRQEAEEF
jgi:uncharacterized protein